MQGSSPTEQLQKKPDGVIQRPEWFQSKLNEIGSRVLK